MNLSSRRLNIWTNEGANNLFYVDGKYSRGISSNGIIFGYWEFHKNRRLVYYIMTLKRLMEYKSSGLESTFLMILRTVTDRKEYLVKTLYEDIGWGGSEYENIFFPKNEVYTKDLAGYFEDGVQLAFFSPGSEKVYDGKEKVYSFTMSYEVAYRYLRLGCEALIEQYPADKEEIDEACKIFRERHNIKEKDTQFNYYNILGNMRKYLVWYW